MIRGANRSFAALIGQAKTDDGIKELREALRDNANYSDARLALANALKQQGQLYEAIGHYEQYLRDNPSDAEVHLVLADALNARKNYNAAIEQCEDAIRLKSDNAKAHYDLAINLEKAGKKADARREYETYLKLAPKAPNAEAVRTILRRLAKS